MDKDRIYKALLDVLSSDEVEGLFSEYAYIPGVVPVNDRDGEPTKQLQFEIDGGINLSKLAEALVAKLDSE